MTGRHERAKSAIRIGILVGLALSPLALARAQGPIFDQVLVTVLRDRIFAATPGEGLVPIGLLAGEEIINTSSKGLNALVQTSVRLLAFSSVTLRWSELRTDLGERVKDRRVLPHLILVRTDKRVYGFQGSLGRWKMEDLGLREEIRDTHAAGFVAVVVTDRRALGFSALTGGFFEQELSSDDPVLNAGVNDNVVILTTNRRLLIFRSQLGIWADLR